MYSGLAVTLRECSLEEHHFFTLIVLNTKFMKVHLSVQNLLRGDGRTDGRTDGHDTVRQFFSV
jgi:hypothetical protein